MSGAGLAVPTRTKRARDVPSAIGNSTNEKRLERVNQLASPTGFELEQPKSGDEAEEFNLIDISKLKSLNE